MEEDEEQEAAEPVRVWVGRLQEFASSLDNTQGTKAIDFCENACDAWQHTVTSDPPPPTSAAILVVLETFRALTQVMLAVALDDANTPDVRDRMTRDAAQAAVKDALDGIRRDGERWLNEGMPSDEEIKQRTSAVGASLKAAQDEASRQMEEEAEDEAEAAADPYGAILGYHDPAHDVAIIFTKVCSFTEGEGKRYRDAYERLRKMLDRELYRHIADESDRLCDVVIGIFHDVQSGQVSLSDEDAMDERRRKVRSALISLTTALQIHQDQTIRQARDTFGRNTTGAKVVEELFNDLKKTSFDYRWLEELRDALLHGDINAFKYQFIARLHGEPEVKINMDREYMLEFTKQTRKRWLKRSDLQAMTDDPSVLDMIKAIQPKMRDLQDKLDKALYPNVADDAAVVKELIGRFNGRRGLYALQTGPGFTRRLGIPPFQRLARS